MEWRAVPGWPGYEVSDNGLVRSVDRTILRRSKWTGEDKPFTIKGRMLKLEVDEWGYRKASLYDKRNGRRARPGVHALVAEAFIGPRPEGMQVLHIVSDPSDNRLSNLRYGTPSENVQQTIAEGSHIFARRTHCKHGHEFTKTNTYAIPAGGRGCRECNRLAQSRYREARRAT